MCASVELVAVRPETPSQCFMANKQIIITFLMIIRGQIDYSTSLRRRNKQCIVSLSGFLPRVAAGFTSTFARCKNGWMAEFSLNNTD